MCRASETAERQSATLMRHAEVDEDDDSGGGDVGDEDGDNARAPKCRKNESCTLEELKQSPIENQKINHERCFISACGQNKTGQ